MKPAGFGADWLARTAWGLSAVVHVGVAAAFLGWAEPTSTGPQAIPVSIVTELPSAGAENGPPAAAGEVPDIAPAAGDPPSVPAPQPEAQPPRQAARAAKAPSDPVPPAIQPAPSRVKPAAETPSPPDRVAAEAVAELPMPERKPATPTVAPASSQTADPPPRRSPPPPRSQTAALPSPPTAPRSETPGNADSSPGAALDVTPATLNVAGLVNPEPEYPMTSRLRGEEGTVLLEVAVSAAGRVTAIRVLESSGHPRLDRAALAAVRNWRFAPARIGDRPIDDVIRQPVVFRLER